MLKKRAVWLLVSAGFVILIAFNFKLFIDFFLPETNRGELIIRTISTPNPISRTETVVFKIPQGFLTSHVPRGGESINLHVGYPAKSFVSQEMYAAQKQQHVVFYISASDLTMGDKFKSAIDDGTLESRYSRTVIRKENGRFFLDELNKAHKERDDISQIFYDAERLHWVHSRLNFISRSAGEGLLKNQPVLVNYSYSTDLEPDPLAMHKWAMSFVESLQVTNIQPTQGK